MKVISAHLDEHERLFLIESDGCRLGPPQVTLAELPAGTCDEIVDALLRLQPFVNVIVTREHHLHPVLDEQRLEQDPYIHV